MAEKPEDQFTNEDKITKGKELYGRGCRNYYVKSYSEAADDLSEACKYYAEAYGVDGDELGDVYLLYAKSLVAVGQEENKLIEVPENEDEDEPAEEDDGEGEQEGGEGESNEAPLETVQEEPQVEKTNGHDEPQPGTSSGTTATETENGDSNDADENEGEEDGGNLEVAWEVLQNAALIFQRQEERGLVKLLDVYTEMANISIENGNFETAIDDFNRALSTFSLLEEADQNDRIAAEIYYKIGLCQSALNLFDESVKSFGEAATILEKVIDAEKAKEQTEERIENIKDLEETLQEIQNKITEIGDVKAEEVEKVKSELAKLYAGVNVQSSSSDGAGTSSRAVAGGSSSMKSPETDKPKPTDISHLIKRKKPDSEVESSPAKKQLVETSPGEKKALPIQEEKVVEENSSVQVATESV